MKDLSNMKNGPIEYLSTTLDEIETAFFVP